MKNTESTTTEMTVMLAAPQLRPGTRFVFAEHLGGEGEILTVETIWDTFGLINVSVEELDDPITLLNSQFVKVTSG
jgi:hypothetical protein